MGAKGAEMYLCGWCGCRGVARGVCGVSTRRVKRRRASRRGGVECGGDEGVGARRAGERGVRCGSRERGAARLTSEAAAVEDEETWERREGGRAGGLVGGAARAGRRAPSLSLGRSLPFPTLLSPIPYNSSTVYPHLASSRPLLPSPVTLTRRLAPLPTAHHPFTAPRPPRSFSASAQPWHRVGGQSEPRTRPNLAGLLSLQRQRATARTATLPLCTRSLSQDTTRQPPRNPHDAHA